MEQKTLENKRTQTAINHNKIAQNKAKQPPIAQNARQQKEETPVVTKAERQGAQTGKQGRGVQRQKHQEGRRISWRTTRNKRATPPSGQSRTQEAVTPLVSPQFTSPQSRQQHPTRQGNERP
jgi:hypothetical protein